MTNVWVVTAHDGEDAKLEVINEGFHGTVGTIADLMEMVEDGSFDSITIARGEVEATSE